MEILFRGTCRFYFVWLLFLIFLFFSMICFFLHFININSINSLEYSSLCTHLSLHYIGKGFLPFMGKFCLFLHSYLMPCIGTLLNLNTKQITQQGFCNKVILESKHNFPHNLCALFPLVIYNFKIKSFPQLSGLSIIPRKQSQPGWKSFFRGTCRFNVWFIFYNFFLFSDDSFLFPCDINFVNNL